MALAQGYPAQLLENAGASVLEAEAQTLHLPASEKGPKIMRLPSPKAGASRDSTFDGLALTLSSGKCACRTAPPLCGAKGAPQEPEEVPAKASGTGPGFSSLHGSYAAMPCSATERRGCERGLDLTQRWP